jgi:glycine cleavage system aminomethyltransferase T
MAAAPSHTSLHGRHAALGARMGAFAGWDMPLYYSTARAEHVAVRTASGVFDVSHMGQLEVSGAEARDALARVLTNDVGALGPGQGQYTLMCEDDGGVIDDLIVYALADRFLLVVNASNVAACRERPDARPPARHRSSWHTPGPAPPAVGHHGPRDARRGPRRARPLLVSAQADR